jgi:signal transduction histidine kinase
VQLPSVYPARRRSGEVRHLQSSLFPIHSGGRRLLGGIVRDVTDQKRTEEALQAAVRRERELNELKSRFVSMVSHEFRTPLATIMTLSSLLLGYRAQLTEEQQLDRLTRIQTQVHRLTTLLDDILAVGKAEAMRANFSPAPLDLDAFCREIIAGAEAAFDNASRIVFTWQATCQPVVDQELLQPILMNLLSNALKYSPPASQINLAVACEPETVKFEISDEGIGIADEDQARLFETFQRGRNVGAVPGTGLGLVIVKQAVEAHRGQIEVESQLGQGTRVTVTLPNDWKDGPAGGDA